MCAGVWVRESHTNRAAVSKGAGGEWARAPGLAAGVAAAAAAEKGGGSRHPDPLPLLPFSDFQPAWPPALPSEAPSPAPPAKSEGGAVRAR